MERKLAHIEIIESLSPIEGADKIEVAQVLGWQCVVKKGEFEVGEMVVYIEVDSVMPEKPEYEFLRDRKFRIRTIKLRGQVSQGLVLPLSILPDKSIKYSDGFNNIGKDVTDLLNITKYLTPSEREEFDQEKRRMINEKNKLKKFMMRYSWFRRLFLSKKQKSNFPYWVSKTDEERVQNLGDKFIQSNEDKLVYVTEKIDYQSGTWTSKEIQKYSGWLGKLIPVKKVLFVVASRNLQTNNKNSLYWKIAEKYDLERICKRFPGIIIQGEQGDTKVQGNKYGIKEPKMWVFNIIMPNGIQLDYYDMRKFCIHNNLDFVPLVSICRMRDIGSSVKDFVEFSKGRSFLADIPREGVVIRCIENGKKIISFKCINPDFLLKYEN